MAEEITLRAYIERIETMIRQGRVDQAIAHSAHVLQFYPKNAVIYRNMGRALMRLQRYEEASEIFRRLLAAIPDDFSAHYQLSIIYEQENNGDAALWHIERAFDQQPNSAQVNDRLRDLYKKFKDVDVEKIQLTAGAVAIQYNNSRMYDEAIGLLQRTLVKVPDRADLLTLLALTQWRRGDAMDAAETALDVLRNYPYALEANRILSELWLQEERPSDAQRYLSRVEDVDPYLAYEIATDDDVADEQFMVEELDFAKYAASLASNEQSPDWLSSIEEVVDAEGEIGEGMVEPAEDLDWLDEVSEDSQPIVPPKKVTDDLSDLLPDDFNFPDSAGTDDTVDEDELAKFNSLEEVSSYDELDAIFGEIDESDDYEGTGLTGLLGEDDDLSAPASRTTGLTGMLSKLGLDDDNDSDEPQTDDLSWLDEVSAGQYDVGVSGESDETPSDIDAADDFFTDMDSEKPEKDDALAWLSTDNLITEDRDEDDEMSTDDLAKANNIDPNDPMAWLQDSGIEFDDDAEDRSGFFIEDEPATIASDELSPMAWLGEDDDFEVEEEASYETVDNTATTDDDSMAWLADSGVELTDSDDEDEFGTDDLSTGDIDDSMAWLEDDGIEIEDDPEVAETIDTNEILTGQLASLNEDSQDIEGDPIAWLEEGGVEFLDDEVDASTEDDDWLADDSVLDDLLNIADLTNTDQNTPIGDELLTDAEMQDTISDDSGWTPTADDDLVADEELDWLSEDVSDEEVDDSMAWLEGDGIEIEDSDDDFAFEAQADDDDDSMAWLEGDGIEIEDSDDDFAFEAQADDDDSMAWLENEGIEIEDEDDELPQAMGKTSLLNFLSDEHDDSEIDTTLEISEDEAFADEGADWLRTLDGEEIEDEDISDEGETFADDFSVEANEDVEWQLDETSEGNDFDWGEMDMMEDDEQELDWTAEPDDEDFFPDFDADNELDDEAEPADMAWLDEVNDMQDDDAIAEPADADWLNELDDAQDDEVEPADMAWLDELDDAQDDNAIAEPADADWLNELDDAQDDDEIAEPTDIGWLDEIDETADGDDDGDAIAEITDEDWAIGAGFTDELDEDPVAEAEDWEVGSGFTDELDEDLPAEDWEVGSGFTDELDEEPIAEAEEPLPQTEDWEVGSGFTDELDEDLPQTEDWEVGSGFTDELDEEPVAELGDTNWLSDLHNEQDDIDTDDLVDNEPLLEDEDDNWLSEIGVQEEVDWDEEYEDDEEYELNISSTTGMSDMLETIRSSREDEYEPDLENIEIDEPEWLKQTGELSPLEQNDEVDWGDEEERQPISESDDTSDDFTLWEADEELDMEEFEHDDAEFEEEDLPIAEFDEDDDDLDAEEFDEAFDMEEFEPDNEFEEEADPLAELDDAEVIEPASEVEFDDFYEEELEQADADNAPDWLNAMVPGLDLDFEAEDEGHLDEGFEERDNTLRERRLSESETINTDFDWLQDIVEEETGAMGAVSDEELSSTPPPTPIAPRKQYTFSAPPIWARDDDDAKESIAAQATALASTVPDYLSDFDEFDDTQKYDFDASLDDSFTFDSEEVATVEDEFDAFDDAELETVDDEFSFNNEDNAINDEIEDEFDNFTDDVEDDFDDFSDEVKDEFEDFTDDIEDKFDNFDDEFDGEFNEFAEEVKSEFDDFKDDVEAEFDTFADEFDDEFDEFEDDFEDASLPTDINEFDFENGDTIVAGEVDTDSEDTSASIDSDEFDFDSGGAIIGDEFEDFDDEFDDEFDEFDDEFDEFDDEFDD